MNTTLTNTPIAIERIFVSWTEQWDLECYITNYVRTRRLPPIAATRAAVHECIVDYTGQPPHTKSDLDYFLDANLGRRSLRR